MKYNGKEIEVQVTSQNDTIKITIIDPDNLKFPFDNINEAAEFLVDEYGGTKEEALMALKNLLQDTDVSQDTVQTETKTEESNHQDLINNIESGNFNGITANELLQYFRYVYNSKYNEEYTVNYNDKKILEDNIKRFGVEETACRIDKLIHNYNAINGGNSKFPRPYVKQLDIHAKNPWISDKLQGMERVVKNTSFNNEKGQEDRYIEISTRDFFNMSMEELDTYCRNEFLKKGIDINDLSLPPEQVKELYKDEIKALEEAEAKLIEEQKNIDRLVNHFKQEYKNKYNKDYNPTDREIEHLRIVVVDRYNYSIEQWEGIISTYINNYDENWKSDKYPEPRISDTNDAYYNYALVREWVIERAYSLFVQGETKSLDEIC